MYETSSSPVYMHVCIRDGSVVLTRIKIPLEFRHIFMQPRLPPPLPYVYMYIYTHHCCDISNKDVAWMDVCIRVRIDLLIDTCRPCMQI